MGAIEAIVRAMESLAGTSIGAAEWGCAALESLVSTIRGASSVTTMNLEASGEFVMKALRSLGTTHPDVATRACGAMWCVVVNSSESHRHTLASQGVAI